MVSLSKTKNFVNFAQIFTKITDFWIKNYAFIQKSIQNKVFELMSQNSKFKLFAIVHENLMMKWLISR